MCINPLINFLTALMGLTKGHMINQARAFVLPCKGMHDETLAVPGMGTEMRTVKRLSMGDSREQGYLCGSLGDGGSACPSKQCGLVGPRL